MRALGHLDEGHWHIQTRPPALGGCSCSCRASSDSVLWKSCPAAVQILGGAECFRKESRF